MPTGQHRRPTKSTKRHAAKDSRPYPRHAMPQSHLRPFSPSGLMAAGVAGGTTVLLGIGLGAVGTGVTPAGAASLHDMHHQTRHAPLLPPNAHAESHLAASFVYDH
jgi:hypothetical protein